MFLWRGCWFWLSRADSAVKYVAACEEGMPGNSEPSQAFHSGKGLTTYSCWEGALLFLNYVALLRGWKARWLKMVLRTGCKAWRRESPLTKSLLLDIINLHIPVLITSFSVLWGDLDSWLSRGKKRENNCQDSCDTVLWVMCPLRETNMCFILFHSL